MAIPVGPAAPQAEWVDDVLDGAVDTLAEQFVESVVHVLVPHARWGRSSEQSVQTVPRTSLRQ